MRSERLWTYIAIVAVSLLMSGGAVVAACTDIIPQTGAKVLWLILPLAAVMLTAVVLNYRVLIPRLFMTQRYAMYAISCLALSMLVPLSGVAIEGMYRAEWGLTARVQDYLSPWILVDSLSTAALLTVIMLGMGVAHVYGMWRVQLQAERKAGAEYTEAIMALKQRIRPTHIMDSLRSIEMLAEVNADAANRELRTLSDELRHHLYEKPVMCTSANYSTPMVLPWLSRFIADKRYALVRDISLKLLIACVSLTAIFEAPDRPELSMAGLWAFLGMFLLICLLTYGNKSLSKHLLRKGRLRGYVVGASVFLVIMTLTAIVLQILSYGQSVHTGVLPPLYTGIATLSSGVTIALYFGGITALIILHYRLVSVHKEVSLIAGTAKAEFDFLQSQINPHFLFNVLNNAGILIYEDPQMAVDMLRRLGRMFEYQFSLTRVQRVPLEQEVEFLRNYLLLEQSRKSPFEFTLTMDAACESLYIPTLLLIPFVENASKHSVGTRDINIQISREQNRLRFVCTNLCDATQSPSSKYRGLGIANTHRRLQLLYGDEYTLLTQVSENRYTITLTIPLL